MRAESELPPSLAARWGWTTAIALFALALYWPALRGALVYDDLLTVARNPLVTSLANVPDMFRHSMWGFYSPESEAAVGYWRPLASVVLALGYRAGATDPFAYHALSLAFHALASVAAFAFARAWTRDTFVAIACGLLFAAHPVHVESVAWISALNDPLFGAFSLLALASFVRWRERGSNGTPWRAGMWLLLALLSKELALAVAPIAVALDIARGRAGTVPGSTPPDSRARAEREPANLEGSTLAPYRRAYTPFVLSMLVYLGARMFVFASPWAGFDKVTTDFGVTWSRLAALRVELLGGFARLLVAPFDARFLRPFVPALDPLSSALLVPLACSLAAIALLVWCWWKRERVLLGFAALALIAIGPLVARPQALGAFPLSDRYLYLAVAGAVGLASYAAWRWLPRAAAFALVAAITITFSVQARSRIEHWRDEETLFREAAAHTPHSPYVQWCLGRVLLERYRRTQEVDALRAAHEAFTRALALGLAAQRGDGRVFAVSNDFLQANVGVGWTLLHLAEIDGWRDFKSAAEVFQGVVRRYPHSEEGWTGLAVAQIQLEQLDAAEVSLARALESNERFAEAHTTLGLLRGKRSDWTGARAAFEAGLKWRPNHLATLLLRGGAEERSGDDARAAETFELASRLHPLDARPLVSRGTLAAKRGDLEAALRDFDEALERRPDLGIAWLQKGRVLAARGEKHGSERAFVRAAELMPADYEANYNAGATLVSTGGVPTAIPFLARAYELRPKGAQGDALRQSLMTLPIQSADTYVALATADADRGEVDSALTWIERAFSLDANHGGAHFLKSGMLRAKGDREGALAELKRASELLPDSLLAHQSLGDSYAELGRRNEALASYKRALDIARGAPATAEQQALTIDALKARIDELEKGS